MLTSSIKFIEGINGNHYVAYKVIGGQWYLYDDHNVTLTQLQKKHRVSLAFYRLVEASLQYDPKGNNSSTCALQIFTLLPYCHLHLNFQSCKA